MNKNNWPPFYIEREERRSMSDDFRSFVETFRAFEEFKNSQKPKEEKKDEKKPNVFKTWLLTSIGLIAAFPFLVWISMSLYMDLILKAKHLPLP